MPPGSPWAAGAATAFQMAPVPPVSGKRNTALGPQPASSLPWMTLVMARVASTVATRSPSHSHCIAVVGYAHTCDSSSLVSTLSSKWQLTYFGPQHDLYMCGADMHELPRHNAGPCQSANMGLRHAYEMHAGFSSATSSLSERSGAP